MNRTKPSAADLIAEANHFRTLAIQQELETGARMPLKADPDIAHLPEGVQKTRPVFSKDDCIECEG